MVLRVLSRTTLQIEKALLWIILKKESGINGKIVIVNNAGSATEYTTKPNIAHIDTKKNPSLTSTTENAAAAATTLPIYSAASITDKLPCPQLVI